MDIVQSLRKSRLFRNLSDPALKRLARITNEQELPAHATLFREGDCGDELFLIRLGTVVIKKKDSHTGESEQIAVLGTGSHFGEMGLVNQDHMRKATIVAREDTYLLSLHNSDLQRLCDEAPGLGYEVYRTLAEGLAKRLATTSDHAAHFKAMARRRAG